LILTSMDNPRAAKIETLMSAVPEYFDVTRTHAAASPSAALQLARELTPQAGLICVTGSLYLVGAVREILSSEGRSG
ncbi:MAG: bifunctional folylpolyglutamate synthase/dihydrofolate synthase, partial [Acidobacteriota bacterium]